MAEGSVTPTSTGSIGFFEKYLTVWVVLCIAGGFALGELAPRLAQTLDGKAIRVNGAPVVSVLWMASKGRALYSGGTRVHTYPSPPGVGSQKEMLVMIRLKVTGMSCAHCEGAVRKALEGVEGVAEVVTVSKDANEAVVEGQADLAALIAAVKEEGFEVEAA